MWYAFTPANKTIVTVDTSGSDYYPDVNVLTGSPGSFTCATHLGTGGSFLALAGQTYYLHFNGVWTSGTLQINVSGQPGPEAKLAIDPRAKVDKHTGVATVTGTFTCANASVPDGGLGVI